MKKSDVSKNENKRAVLYCRVSTKEQVEEGNSLQTQEKLCREYVVKHGFEVAEVFIELGESAKTKDRTQLKKLLHFCSNKKNNIQFVIVYKLDRISRNTDDYSQLRILLRRYGVEIKSTTEYFEDTPAGRFMENIIANVAQFDNDVRTERSVGGMHEAVREGRYVWMAPLGYENVKVNGKSTVALSSMAPLVLRAFKAIASGTSTVEAVHSRVIKNGLITKKGTPPSKTYFYKMLSNELYKGMIVKFGERHKGAFTPLVSEEVFDRVQWVLKRKKNTRVYQKVNPDFPLRRFVTHKQTGKKLTGCWAKGYSRKYPYYFFPGTGKTYGKDALENAFAKHLNKYRFTKEQVELLKEKLIKFLNLSPEYREMDKQLLISSIKKLEDKREKLLQKNLIGIISDELLKRSLEPIEEGLSELRYELAQEPKNNKDIPELLDFVSAFLLNPGGVWLSANPKQQVALQQFEFPKGLLLENLKFQTVDLAFVFKVKDQILDENYPKVGSREFISNARSAFSEKYPDNTILFWSEVINEMKRFKEACR